MCVFPHAGRVDNDGRLVFAELSGRVGWLKPDGEEKERDRRGETEGGGHWCGSHDLAAKSGHSRSLIGPGSCCLYAHS